MLADGVEASVRSLTSRDEPAIRAMVSRIIEERSGRRPVRRVRPDPARHRAHPRGVRRSSCSGMYHQRIAYPQNKIVELESRRAAAGDEGR